MYHIKWFEVCFVLLVWLDVHWLVQFLNLGLWYHAKEGLPPNLGSINVGQFLFSIDL